MASPPPPWFIAIGASGSEGLDDIIKLLRELPSSLFAVVLIVLHRPWHHVSRLQAVLARESQLPVVIATHGERFEPGTVYIGEPEDHLTLATKSFGFLIHDPKRQYGNRTIDLLFQSVAAHGGKRVVGVILSGVNAGEKMHQRAGVKLHQDGMPKASIGGLLLGDKQDEKRIASPENVTQASSVASPPMFPLPH